MHPALFLCERFRIGYSVEWKALLVQNGRAISSTFVKLVPDRLGIFECFFMMQDTQISANSIGR